MVMWSAIILSALAMTAIIALRYIVSSGLFAWISVRVKPGIYDGQTRQIWREIGWSLLSAAIYGIPAGIVAWGWQARGWTLIYTRWDAYSLWYLPIAPLIYLFLHDTWFYWTHRLMHRPTLFRAMHAVHHASRPPTAWAAMSFHPYEAITGALVIPVLVFLVPIHVAMLGIVLLIMTVMGIINHMGWEIVPRRIIHSRLGAWLITASHHHRHHEQYQCNFGLYFRIWDRLCRTDGGLSQP